MTLRLKTLLIVTATLFALLITLYLSLSVIWLNGFAKIESQRTQLNVQRVVEALNNDLKELHSTVEDWATWDDTYSFVQDVSETYIQTNLRDTAILNLRINIMLFLNQESRIVYDKGLDLQKQVTVPIPNSLRQYVTDHPQLFQIRDVNSHLHGIIILPESPLLITAYPILNSDRTAPSRGTLIFGRFLNEAEIKRFSDLTRITISLYPLSAIDLPREVRSLAETSPTQSRIIIRPLSPQRIAGYTLLKDIQGQPGLVLRVDSPRDIYQQGKQGLRYLLASLLAVGVTFGIVTILLLEKSVLSPLSRLSSTVRGIRASGDLSRRLVTKDSDELASLANAMNQLLATLQESQLQLRQSQQKYQSVVDNIQEVIFQTDTTGKWTFLNPAWTEITGFSVTESLGFPCGKFIHPEDRAHHYQQFYQLLEGEISENRYEVRYQTTYDSFVICEVNCRRMLVADGTIYGIAGTLNDITERKLAQAREQEKTQELEETLRKLTQTQSQLIQSEKMSSLGHLVAGVAHEINNPISFVYSNIYHAKDYSQNLIHLIKAYHKNYPEPPPEIQSKIDEFDLAFLLDDLPKLLHSMEIGADRIREIVKSLRNFSRLDEAELKTVDLHEGLDSTLLILQHQLKAKGNCAEIKLVKEYGNLPKVMCYPGQLNQVFMNLIANAIDALDEKRVKSGDDSVNMPWIRIKTEINKGSLDGQQDTSVKKLAIKTQSQLLVSEYEYDTLPLMSTPIYSSDHNYSSVAPESILIRIADNGMGMTQEVLSSLFEPFFTTKPAGKGTGLGLSISYRIIVEKHKGKLLVNSSLGQGTEFIIELPLQ